MEHHPVKHARLIGSTGCQSGEIVLPVATTSGFQTE